MSIKEEIDFKSVFVTVGIIALLFGLGFVYAQEEDITRMQNNIDKQLVQMDLTIQEGLTECFDLQNNNCITVMSTLDNICQSIYSPYCFGPMWNEYVEYKEDLIDKGHLSPDYEQGEYYNLNNDHFGNDRW